MHLPWSQTLPPPSPTVNSPMGTGHSRYAGAGVDLSAPRALNLACFQSFAVINNTWMNIFLVNPFCLSLFPWGGFRDADSRH